MTVAVVYRCLVALGNATPLYRDMDENELIRIFGLAKGFEISISTMPLAQTPRSNLLVLIKMFGDENQQAWIRLNLTRPQSEALVNDLMGSLT